MALSDKILERLEKLPNPLQAQVLDFVEYLEFKVSKANKRGSADEDWSRLSLSFAMQGMEGECSLYSPEDIEEIYT